MSAAQEPRTKAWIAIALLTTLGFAGWLAMRTDGPDPISFLDNAEDEPAALSVAADQQAPSTPRLRRVPVDENGDIEPQHGQGGTIHVKCEDRWKRAVAGMLITIRRSDTQSPHIVSRGTTDAAGALDVTGLPAGEYLVEAPGVSTELIRLDADGERQITLEIEDNHGTVRVVDARGKGIADATVVAVLANDFDRCFPIGRTSAAGTFSIRGIWTAGVWIGALTDDAASRCAPAGLPGRDTMVLRCVQPRVATDVLVTAAGEPVRGAEVRIGVSGRENLLRRPGAGGLGGLPPMSVLTDENGRATVLGLCAGWNLVRASAPLGSAERWCEFIGPRSRVVVNLRGLATVLVRDRDGKPVADCYLYRSRHPKSRRPQGFLANTDENGRCSVGVDGENPILLVRSGYQRFVLSRRHLVPGETHEVVLHSVRGIAVLAGDTPISGGRFALVRDHRIVLEGRIEASRLLASSRDIATLRSSAGVLLVWAGHLETLAPPTHATRTLAAMGPIHVQSERVLATVSGTIRDARRIRHVYYEWSRGRLCRSEVDKRGSFQVSAPPGPDGQIRIQPRIREGALASFTAPAEYGVHTKLGAVDLGPTARCVVRLTGSGQGYQGKLTITQPGSTLPVVSREVVSNGTKAELGLHLPPGSYRLDFAGRFCSGAHALEVLEDEDNTIQITCRPRQEVRFTIIANDQQTLDAISAVALKSNETVCAQTRRSGGAIDCIARTQPGQHLVVVTAMGRSKKTARIVVVPGRRDYGTMAVE